MRRHRFGPTRPLTIALGAVALAALALPTVGAAHHVTASPEVSALLGEERGSSWEVKVNWAINCSGAQTPTYGGNLNLVDQANGEEHYLGGVFSGDGQVVVRVSRKRTRRILRPTMTAFCSSGLPELHGSGTVETIGNPVVVPALDTGGSGGGSRGGHGSQGGRDFPGGGFGAPSAPLGPGGCANELRGTGGGDRLKGTGAGDLVFGLGGDDLIRGLAGGDCLVGDDGDDRLRGGGGADRLTGGAGADRLRGGGGVNRYDAGPGSDVVDAVNGRRELVSCGGGEDRARVDRVDSVGGCERVTTAG